MVVTGDRHARGPGTDDALSAGPAPAAASFLHVTAAGCLLLLVLVVPLVFDPGHDEVFAPVKILVAEVLLGLGLVAAALAVVAADRPPPADPCIDPTDVPTDEATPGRGAGGVPDPTGTATALARQVRPVARVADLAVAAFAVLNLLAYAASQDRSVSLHGQFPEYQGLVTLLTYVAAYALARVVVWGPRRLGTLLAAPTVVGGLAGGYAVLQRLGLDPLWGQVSRPFATVGQANSMAAVLVVTLPCAAATALRSRGVARAAAVVAGVFALAGLVVSESRGGWLAAGVALLLALVLTQRRHRARAGLVAAGLVVAVTATLLVTPAGHDLARHVAKRARALDDTGEGSVGLHLALTQVGLLVTADHPWLGIGQDVFPQVAQDYADRHLDPTQADLLRPYAAESPHDELLGISSSAGLPALLAYLVALGAAAVAAVRGRGRHPVAGTALLVAVAAHLVTGLFMTAEVSSQLLAWTLLGAAVRLPSVPPEPRATLPHNPSGGASAHDQHHG